MTSRHKDLAGGTSLGASETASEAPLYVAVRATVNLPFGMPKGREAIVDAQDPRIQQLLACEWIIPLDEPDAIQRGG